MSEPIDTPLDAPPRQRFRAKVHPAAETPRMSPRMEAGVRLERPDRHEPVISAAD